MRCLCRVNLVTSSIKALLCLLSCDGNLTLFILFSVCKSCLLQRIESGRTSCPSCGIQLQRSRLSDQLRLDHAVQALVYAAVPGLFEEEQRRRKHFVDHHPLCKWCNHFCLFFFFFVLLKGPSFFSIVCNMAGSFKVEGTHTQQGVPKKEHFRAITPFFLLPFLFLSQNAIIFSQGRNVCNLLIPCSNYLFFFNKNKLLLGYDLNIFEDLLSI